MAILYHYCDAASFKSIVEKKALWLCNTRKMNDASETVLIERMFEEIIDESESSGKLSSTEAREIRDDYMVNKAESFACSLSEERDSTVQWKSYADQGRGFALGFDSDALWTNSMDSFLVGDKGPFYAPRRATPTENTLALSKVLYCKKTTLASVKSHLEATLRRKSPSDVMRDVFLVDRVVTMASICKESSFSHENEWRLIYLPVLSDGTNDPVCIGHIRPMLWRTTRFGIAPYFEFPFAPTALKEIWLGPTNPDASQKSAIHLLRLFLGASGFGNDVSILESISPYRG